VRPELRSKGEVAVTGSAAGGPRPTFSVCIPLYNAEATIGETIESVRRQTFDDFEVVVVDDCSTDSGPSVVTGFRNPRIRLVRNERNLGYAGNLARCFELAEGEFVYLLGNDDILSPVALERTNEALRANPSVALVTRPYYWFESDDPTTPVRFIPPLDARADRVVRLDTDDASFVAVLNSISQLSGLALRRNAVVLDEQPECFTAHVYPFLSMWKRNDVAFLREYVVAVRIASSQTRSIPGIYEPSPAATWVALFDSVLGEERYARQRRAGRALIASHVEGLIQIRCHAGFNTFVREAAVLVRYRPANLLWWKFWLYTSALTVLSPRVVRGLVDRFKPIVTGARREPIPTLAREGAAPQVPTREPEVAAST
jgi:glycosyltransferase involved in cell wall biosynthesis